MAYLGLFSSSIMGMRSQSHALNVIGTNIANVNTGGYRRTDTHFSSILSDTMFEQSDLGGAATKDYFRINNQGSIVSSDLNTDLAIGGQGFYVLNSELDGSGDTYYSRDGSFRMVTGDQETVTYPDDTTATVDTGYLVDKNGYYLMGAAASDDGTFDVQGSLQALRVDPFAFVNQGTATTEATLVLNLDANETQGNTYRYTIDVYDSDGARQNVNLDFTKNTTLNQWTLDQTTSQDPVAQVDTLTIGGTVETGDQYTVTVNGTGATYTVLAGDTLSDIQTGIINALNANATVANTVTVAASGTNGITLTAATAGDDFTTATSTTQVATDAAQVDTFTLSGTIEAGDVYGVTIGGTTAQYTVVGGDTQADVRNGLVAAINASGLGATVTAAPGGTNAEFTVTADTAGTPFTATTSTTHGGTSVAQVDTVTLAGTIEAGDVYSVTIGATTAQYTAVGGDTLTDVRNNLVTAINASTLATTITAAPGGAAGELTLTANTAGSAFTATPNAVNGNVTADNTAVLANTVANYTAVADEGLASATTTANHTATPDQTLTAATTTANVADTVTTTVGTIQFNSDATVDTPQTMTLNLTFAGGSTADVELDISNMTQYGGQYAVRSYERDGRVSADMVDWRFDSEGFVTATFDDNSVRNVYKVPLAVCRNPDGLDISNGMTFRESELSGEFRIVEAGSLGYATFTPNALELSNVSIEDQFSKMIMTQTAYNASATSFKTVDEMISTAKDMKR